METLAARRKTLTILAAALASLAFAAALPAAEAHVSPASQEWCGDASFPDETLTLHVHRYGSRICTNLEPNAPGALLP